jgi:hypothetical protein
MKQILLLAGAVALASAGAASAKPPHAGHGKGKGQAARVLQGHQGHVGYGTGGCPPGLAKKNAACMPPGQYKKLFEVGQRVPVGYKGLLGYDALPYDLRSRHRLDPYGRYIYDQHYLYRVDPATMVVNQILRAVL